MKGTLMRGIITICLVATTMSVNANQLDKQWRARYDSLERIYFARNFAKWKSLISDEYQWTQPNGKVVSRKDSISMIEPLFKAKSFQVKEEIKGISRRGEVIDVSFEMKLKIVMQDGKSSGFHEIGIDSWRKVHGKWKLIGTRDQVAEETAGK